MLNETTCVMALKKLKNGTFSMFNDSTKAKNGLSNMALYPLLGPFCFGPFYTFLAPSTTTPSTPSWLLLLRPHRPV